MNVLYHVELSQAERGELTTMLSKGKRAARKLKRARARSQGATDRRFRTTAIAQAPTAPAPQQLLSRRTGCVGVAVVVSACQSQVPQGDTCARDHTSSCTSPPAPTVQPRSGSGHHAAHASCSRA